MGKAPTPLGSGLQDSDFGSPCGHNFDNANLVQDFRSWFRSSRLLDAEQLTSNIQWSLFALPASLETQWANLLIIPLSTCGTVAPVCATVSTKHSEHCNCGTCLCSGCFDFFV